MSLRGSHPYLYTYVFYTRFAIIEEARGRFGFLGGVGALGWGHVGTTCASSVPTDPDGGCSREVPDSRPQSRKLYRPARPRPALWALWCRRPKTQRWLHSREGSPGQPPTKGLTDWVPGTSILTIDKSRGLVKRPREPAVFSSVPKICFGHAHFRLF